jgi:hypothetical protein
MGNCAETVSRGPAIAALGALLLFGALVVACILKEAKERQERRRP